MLDRRTFALALLGTPLYAGPLVLFSGPEHDLLALLVEQIIPADDTAPSAREAGVVFYIDKQLAGPLQRFAAEYRRGLPLLESACRTQTGHSFGELDFAARTAFLQQIESGQVPGLATFFSMVIDHTMQGFYGSPMHGGNRDEASWKMLGIEHVMGGHAH